jgi:hypothetical protein
MEMGKVEMPDTFGLQEFYVTDIYTEVAGANVRLVCGAKRGGVMHWLYSVVIPAERLIETARQCREAAERAFSKEPTLETEASALH